LKVVAQTAGLGNALNLRIPAHAGQYYPADAGFLEKVVDEYLTDGGTVSEIPKAVIAPHAGFIHSGRIAGKAFAVWKAQEVRARRVVLIGPSHYYDFPGIALPDSTRFQTPLGEVQVDPAADDLKRKFRYVRVFEAAHYPEHALEVLLPFLQRAVPGAKIVPLITGRTEMSQVSAVIEEIWGGADTLLVISSDLSHNHPYEIAQKVDRQTARAIVEFDFSRLTADQACAYQAMRGFLKAAIRKEMRCSLLELRNSADASGDMSLVTGFGAFHFFE